MSSNTWIQATKEWRASKGEKMFYPIPKKGSNEYDEIKAIQEKLKKTRE